MERRTEVEDMDKDRARGRGIPCENVRMGYLFKAARYPAKRRDRQTSGQAKAGCIRETGSKADPDAP